MLIPYILCFLKFSTLCSALGRVLRDVSPVHFHSNPLHRVEQFVKIVVVQPLKIAIPQKLVGQPSQSMCYEPPPENHLFHLHFDPVLETATSMALGGHFMQVGTTDYAAQNTAPYYAFLLQYYIMFK